MIELGVIVGIISLLAAVPTLSKYLVGYFHKPDLKIWLESRSSPIYWAEFYSTTFQIWCQNEKLYKIEYEIRTTDRWKFRSKSISKHYNTYTRGNLFIYKKSSSVSGKDILLSKDDGLIEAPFPLDPENKKGHMEIVIYPQIELSEFSIPFTRIKLPNSFPSVELQPVKKKYYITDDLSEIAIAHAGNEKRIKQITQIFDEEYTD